MVLSDWLVGAEDVELGQCLLDAVGDMKVVGMVVCGDGSF